MNIIRHDNERDMVQSLAGSITDAQPRSLILPGGSSPIALIHELAARHLNWDALRITTTDERCVPHADPESNIGQIARIFEEQGVSAQCTSLLNKPPILPTDITILGMGPDAHIASLFPGVKGKPLESGLLKITAPKPPPERVSLTLRQLCDTERLILLVNSAQKWDVLEQITQGGLHDTPLAHLISRAGKTLEIHGF